MIHILSTTMKPETMKTAAENDYFGLLDIDEKNAEDVLRQCPYVFRRLGERCFLNQHDSTGFLLIRKAVNRSPPGNSNCSSSTPCRKYGFYSTDSR